jgi:hypothetical protein
VFTGNGSPSSSPSFSAAVAAFTLDGPGRLPQFSSGQVAALALAVEGGLGVAGVPRGHQLVAVLAFPHREALPPEVAAALVVMMALLAGDPGLGVARVAEEHRRFLRQGLSMLSQLSFGASVGPLPPQAIRPQSSTRAKTPPPSLCIGVYGSKYEAQEVSDSQTLTRHTCTLPLFKAAPRRSYM